MPDPSNERRAFFREIAGAAMGVKRAADEALAEPAQPSRYEGQDPAARERLSAAAVLVVGAGAVGSPVALYLAGAGIGRLGVVDPAEVALADLSGQLLHFTPDAGVPKAHSAVAKLGFLNPEIRVEPYQAEFSPAMLAGQDLVVDTAGAVAEARACVVVRARVEGAGGFVAVVPPGAPLLRDGESVPESPLYGGVRDTGARGAVAGVVGSLAARAALAVLGGLEPVGDGYRLELDLQTPSLVRRPLS